jgi:hypothetical protein
MTTPASQYLSQIESRLAAIRADVPRFTRLGEAMASSLVAGGALFTPDVGTYWPSEFGGRAGGLMGLKPSDYVATSPNDVAFTTLPAGGDLRGNDAFRRLLDGVAKVVIIGRAEDIGGLPRDRFLGFTGGAAPDDGPHALAPVRPFEQLVRGWLTAGEMVAACTRAGKMPILWMSVWLEGALVRNASFFRHDNVREPWYPPLFHDPIYIPPLKAGSVADAFLTELETIFRIVVRQTEKLVTAGQWLGDAVRAGRRPSVVLVGHSYPQILELPKQGSDYPLAWLPSVSDLRKAHPSELSAGDVALHLGYSPVDVADVSAILDRGVRFIYSSPYGRPDSLKDHPNLIWLDLPWRPGDATVDIPGYSVRLLPMSSSAHTIVYFALMAELAGRMGRR